MRLLRLAQSANPLTEEEERSTTALKTALDTCPLDTIAFVLTVNAVKRSSLGPCPLAARPVCVWKQAFAWGMVESRRTRLTKSELCSMNWAFRFKAHMNAWGTQMQHPIPCRFETDGTYVSEMMNQTMTWRTLELAAKSGLSSERLSDVVSTPSSDGSVADSIFHVQVDQYPALCATRTSDGGWQLENVNAILLEQ
jgi:hypothetical protein